MGATRVGRRRTMGRSRTSQRRWPGSPTSSRTPAAGGALPGIVGPDRQRARRGDDCAVGSDRPLRGGHRCGKVRPLRALLRRQRPGLRPGRGHRLRARDERDLVLVGLRPRPAPHVRGGLAAHRAAVPRPGLRQRHLAVDDQRRAAQHRADRAVVARRGHVTWVGIDGYYYRPTDSFGSVFGTAVTQVRLLTGKPVLLSETAVGRAPGRPPRSPRCSPGFSSSTLGLAATAGST
jgi:hypothetical protein